MFTIVRLAIGFIMISNQVFSDDNEDFIRSITLKGNKSISNEKNFYLVRQKPPKLFV